jgi:nucleoside-diphosphate-sugar epimerase
MGYVGPGVVEHLRREYPGARLIGLDTGFFAANLLNDRVLPECALDAQFFGDVRDAPPGSLRDIDAVVHLAAISNDPMGNAFERVTGAINYEGAIAMARAARRAGVRHFVFASSCNSPKTGRAANARP